MFEHIKSFVRNRPEFIAFVVFLAICTGILMALQGCNLAALVKVDVPPQVAAAVGVEDGKTTLANADAVLEDWKAYVQTNNKKLTRAIEDANERYAVLVQVTDIGIRTVDGELSGIPGGTILLSGLSLIAGLFLKRPGEDSRVAKEKRDSYNKGIEVGVAIKENA